MKRRRGLILVLGCLWFGWAWDAEGGGIPLAATASAPPGANGHAEIGPGSISLNLERMTPGIYQVQVLLKSSNTRVTLAWVSVVDPDWGPDREAGDSIKTRSSAHQATVVTTTTQISLPPGFQAAEIASVAVADRAGVEWLVGPGG